MTDFFFVSSSDLSGFVLAGTSVVCLAWSVSFVPTLCVIFHRIYVRFLMNRST